jgi:L-threonylcarbamoyladenylate synthase
VHASDLAQTLAAAFWPGPLTMVLSRRVTSGVDLLAGAGLDTLAIRVPGSPPARDLLGEAGIPVAAPSANRSGSISPTTASDVLAELSGRIDAVLDFGPATVGLESTVLDLTGPVPFLLRPGGIPIEGIAALCGRIGTGISLLQAEASRGLRSPGLLVSHYAPVLPVRLNALEAAAGEALLAFGPHPPEAALVYQLSPDGDLQEAAARLFSGLRWLDVEGRGRGLSRIATMKVPEHGLGAAINDRLQRAASPR